MQAGEWFSDWMVRTVCGWLGTSISVSGWAYIIGPARAKSVMPYHATLYVSFYMSNTTYVPIVCPTVM